MDITQCACCLVLPPEKDLKSKNVFEDSTEIYSDMLSDCFNIKFKPEILRSDPGICHICVQQLRAAVNFKKQILTCQRVLQSHVKEERVEKGESEGKYQSEDVLLDDIKEEEIDVNFDYTTDGDTKMVTLDNDSDEDDINLLLLAKVKELRQPRKTLTDNAGPKVKKRNADDQGKKKITPKSKSFIDKKKPKKSTIILLHSGNNKLAKQKHNHHTLIKNSNAIPFTTKTLQGYVCAYCSDTYQQLQKLRQHQISQHGNDEITYAKKKFSSAMCLNLDITDLKCSICDEKCNLLDDLKTHLTSKHNIKLYDEVKDHIVEFKLGSYSNDGDMMQCALCQSSYETFKTLMQHMNNHYRNFVCEVCNLGFVNLLRLKSHVKTHEEGSYKCSYCEKVFSSKIKLFCHEKYSHKNATRYLTTCPNCDETFTNYYQRNKHMSVVHNIAAATYKCNICDKNFVVKSKLTMHIKKIHLMERYHFCTLCGEGFFMKQYLDEHMIKHNGERTFKCTECGKAYARKKTLKEHMRIHNNDRRFKCEVCDMTFVQKCSLKSHMLSNHGLNLNEFMDSKSYTNTLCDFDAE